MKANGKTRVLHAFGAHLPQEGAPRGALLQGQDGLLYGSTGHFARPATAFRLGAR